MKIRYYSHATFQIISASGVGLLSDPWLYSPIYGNMMWQFPECPIPLSQYLDQDILYISHNHPDHFCPQTLSHFRRDIPIIIRHYSEANNPIKPFLVEMGFHHIIELEHFESYQFKDFLITLIVDFATVDSAMIISDTKHSVFFQNDCMLPISEVELIGRKFDLDAALLFFSSASIYPTFFKMEDSHKISESLKRNKTVFQRTLSYAVALNTNYVIPCAGDCVYFRLPQADRFCGSLPIEFKEYARVAFPNIQVITPKVGVSINLDDIKQSVSSFTPDFKTKDEWLESLRQLRLRSDVSAITKEIERWEEGFEWNSSCFESLMLDYCRYVEDKFSNFFDGSLVKLPQIIMAFLTLTEDEQYFYIIKIEFKIKKCLFEKLSRFDFDIHYANQVHATIEVKPNHLAMVAENILTFDDLKAGYLVIDRTNEFSSEEVAFWHFLSLFSTFLYQEKGIEFKPVQNWRVLPKLFA